MDIVKNEEKNPPKRKQKDKIINSMQSDEMSLNKKKSKPLIKKKTTPMELIYSCEICQKTFKRKNRLVDHMYRHSISQPHACSICSKKFKSIRSLNIHKKIHNASNIFYSCNLCDYQTTIKASLKSHQIRRHTQEYKFNCQHCGKLFKLMTDYKYHLNDHKTEMLICEICGISFTNKNSFYGHIKYRHNTSVKKFECEICKKKFINQTNLNNHIELHKIKFICDQCGKEFRFKYNLAKHIHLHSDEKSFLCNICGKTFRQISSQKIHLLTHVGEKPYKCDICGQSFTQRSPMMLHRRKQHADVHSRPPSINIKSLLLNMENKIIDKAPKRQRKK